MPDGSSFSQVSNSSITQTAHFDLDPVELGYVTGEEWAALKRYWAAKKKKPQGPADFAALSARTILHTWAGTSDTMPIYRGSVRYWWLLAFFENRWIEARGNEPLRPHERAAMVLCNRGSALHQAKAAFCKVSRFALVLARQCRDQRTVERIEACPREKRLELVLEARRKWRLALRAFFRAIESYRVKRSIHDQQAAKAPSLWRELRRADREDTQALQAWEAEQQRVRAMHPPCPDSILDAGIDRRYVPAAEQWVKKALAEGSISKTAKAVADLKTWKAACKAIDQKHLDRSLERARKDAQARLAQLDKRLREAPAKSLADIRAKLDYVLRYEDFGDDGAKEVVRGLRRDVPAWDAMCW